MKEIRVHRLKSIPDYENVALDLVFEEGVEFRTEATRVIKDASTGRVIGWDLQYYLPSGNTPMTEGEIVHHFVEKVERMLDLRVKEIALKGEIEWRENSVSSVESQLKGSQVELGRRKAVKETGTDGGTLIREDFVSEVEERIVAEEADLAAVQSKVKEMRAKLEELQKEIRGA